MLLTEDLLDLARLRVEDAEPAGALRRVVDGPAGRRRGRDVVRVRAAHHVVIDGRRVRGGRHDRDADGGRAARDPGADTIVHDPSRCACGASRRTRLV